MILIIQPQPARILGAAVVFGYEGASLLATGIPHRAENQIIAGSVFSLLGVAAAFYGLRWSWRFIREFFR